MASAALFSGTDLGRVETSGRTRLPRFVLRALRRAGGIGPLVLGPHESEPCITAYEEAREGDVYAELERRRLRDEEAGLSAESHHARLRHAFGAAATAEIGPGGDVELPPRLRRRGRIDGLALFVGTGGAFEIWNPSVALEARDEVLRELAAALLADADEAREEGT